MCSRFFLDEIKYRCLENLEVFFRRVASRLWNYPAGSFHCYDVKEAETNRPDRLFRGTVPATSCLYSRALVLKQTRLLFLEIHPKRVG